MATNHFDFFEIPVQFYLDEVKLKKQFYALSRKYHPDQHTIADAEVQADALQKASQTNEAYKVLKDFFKRLKYVLRLKGVLHEDSRNEKLPQDFLMEMMDINEEIMEVQMEENQEKKEALIATIFEMEKNLFSEIRNTLIEHDAKPEQKHDLSSVKAFYLKRQYLKRLQDNLIK